MAASPAIALSRAHVRARRMLFPIQSDKWIYLGFIAFLAELGNTGSTLQMLQWPGSPSSGTSVTESIRQGIAELERQLADKWHWVGPLIALAVVVGTAIAVALLWVSSRGKLLFIESVIHDRFAVSEPWRRLHEPSWSVFKARLWVALLGGALTLAVLGAAAAIAWPDLSAERFGARAIVGLLLLTLILPVSLVSWLFLSLLDDFLAPIVYLDGASLAGAWSTFRARLLPGNAGAIALFYVTQLALGFVVGTVAFVAACLTCCLAALPYVSAVVLLPVHVFLRAFSLHFLEELGKPVFPEEPLAGGWHGEDRFPGSRGSGGA